MFLQARTKRSIIPRLLLMKLPKLIKDIKPFDVNVIPDGAPFPLINFYLGEDIILTLPVELTGGVLEDFLIKAYLKSGVASTETLWVGDQYDGLTLSPATPGVINIAIAKKVTEKLNPGTYWLDIVAQQKIGTGSTIDRLVVLARLPIGLDRTAFTTTTEQLNPRAVDITKF